MNCILLLSGTSEGPLLARALLAAGFSVRATVTRPEARENLFGSLLSDVVGWVERSEAHRGRSGPRSARPTLQRLSVDVRGFTEESLTDFLHRGEADLVLDATHPFAVRITRIAQTVCERMQVPYVRYERPDWEPPAGTHGVNSYAAAAAVLPSLGARAMLTIGAKQLKHFAALHDRLTLFARILPAPVSLRQALESGFAEENLVRQRPPFSLEENRALFRHCRVDVLVTKASGREGGVVEKVTAARQLGMNVLMIRRPTLPFPPLGKGGEGEGGCVTTTEEAVRACQSLLQPNH